jgi:hypothetical protein
MEPRIKILPITPGSDGDGRKWPKHHYERNDEYFKERIATDKWIHDLPGGPQAGVIYKLDKLPAGYAGFQRTRPDSKHVDRYIYGHPNGQFRSLNEFYPHFQHLMDHGGPVGCTCKLCANGSSRPKAKLSTPKATGSDYISEASGDQGSANKPVNLIPPFKPGFRPNDEQWRPQKRKLNDVEGVPDIYEELIKRLKDAGPEESLDKPITERMSPDWRVGNVGIKEHIDDLLQLPRYVPRPGELVLFDDGLKDGQHIAWDNKGQNFMRQESRSGPWLEPAKWKVGVVTQTPKEDLSEQDLVTDAHKERAVNESGFRIQLLSKPGEENKSFSKQLKYVPLHAIRPFYLWQDCLKGVPEQDWHPTVQHALTVASSFCVIGRFRFRGVWPNATVFTRGVYLGPELIVVGDTVRLTPRKNEQSMDNVTDVMVVTAIRLRFVNLDMEDDDMAPELPGLPYQTCLHFSGRVYTLDPTRSFDGVGKLPINAESDVLPVGIAAYGQWYNYSDPEQTSARTELPYTRILGRCIEGTAPATWFKNDIKTPSLSSFQVVNSKGKAAVRSDGDKSELSRGLQGILEARAYSQKTDKRIKSQEGKMWYWADTRVDQLDLHEVNQRDVGTKNKERTKGHMAKWKAALKAIDGKKGAVEDYKAVKSKTKGQAIGQSSYGMMRAPASSTEPEPERLATSASTSANGSGQEPAEDEDGDAMDVDDVAPQGLTLPQPVKPLPSTRERMGAGRSSTTSGSGGAGYETPPTVPPKQIESITLSDSEDEDHLVNDQLVGELSKNMRRNDARRGQKPREVIELD